MASVALFRFLRLAYARFLTEVDPSPGLVTVHKQCSKNPIQGGGVGDVQFTCHAHSTAERAQVIRGAVQGGLIVVECFLGPACLCVRVAKVARWARVLGGSSVESKTKGVCGLAIRTLLELEDAEDVPCLGAALLDVTQGTGGGCGSARRR